jgi:hypothetical protein
MESLSSFFDCHASEISQLNDPSPSRIDGGQAIQRFVNINKTPKPVMSYWERFVERHRTCTSASFDIQPGPGVVDKHSTHQLRRNAKKMAAISPLNVFPVD